MSSEKHPHPQTTPTRKGPYPKKARVEESESGDLQYVRNLATELLPLFGFADFKDAIKAVVDRATHFDFDWDGVEKSRLFQTRLQKRRRGARNAADVDDDWKKDVGEKATRIWEWWRPVTTNEAEFPCFSLALKIIGTLQVSSCAVERVFSLLQVIREVCGDKLYEDILCECLQGVMVNSLIFGAYYMIIKLLINLR